MKSFLKKRPVSTEFSQACLAEYPQESQYIVNSLECGIRAISLVSSVSLSTAFANDVASDMIFAQQFFGLAKENDVLWGISTSGNSANVNHALCVAKVLKCKALGLSEKNWW